MVMHRVVVTGMGCITPFGTGTSLLHQSLIEGKSALNFDKSLGFVVGAISEESADFCRWNAGQRREMSRASQLALLAAEEAMSSAKAESVDHTDTLVNIGTGVTDLETIGETYQLIQKSQSRRVSPYFVPRILNNLPAGYVAMKYGMMGGAESASTACATGLHCLGNAFRAVRYGWARRALAGAAEGCVNSIAVTGFDRMRALSRGENSSISCPFDVKRSGFVLSEGVGLLFLERLDDALARRANILAEICGFGISSDCYHISSPDPSGIGATLSMTRAIKDSNLCPDDISYVNAHATSTPTGDVIEARAISRLFSNQNIFVSSIKGHIGHLLAAAGAVETVATVNSIIHSMIPANLNLSEPENVENVIFLRKSTAWNTEKRIAVVNSFGFGGTNASIVVSNFL